MRCLQSSLQVVAFWQLNMSLTIKSKERKESFKDVSQAMANASIFAMKIAPPKRVGTLEGIPEQSISSKSKASTTSYIMGRASDVSTSNTDSKVSFFIFFSIFIKNT